MKYNFIKFSFHKSFSHHWQGRIDFNTVLPCLSTGMDFHQNSEVYWEIHPRKVLGNPPHPPQYLPCFWWSTNTF